MSTNPVSGAVGAAIASSKNGTPTAREEDPRTRAARRALELREHLGDNLGDDADEFYIDPRIIPDGWSYEWKTLTVLGQANPSYQVAVAQRGWEPVPRSRHPQMMPDNHRGETIERKGMILMERPKEITDDVNRREYQKAREQVRGKQEQLGAAPTGTFQRDNKGTQMVSIKKSFETVKIPD